MIPTQDLAADFELEEQPTKTYRVNRSLKKINGRVDGLTAMEQAVYKILNTQRYDYLIYSWNYGSELNEFVGQPIALAYPEIKRKIKEALLQDERVTDVYDFSYTKEKSKLRITFTVTTNEGEITAEKEVWI